MKLDDSRTAGDAAFETKPLIPSATGEYAPATPMIEIGARIGPWKRSTVKWLSFRLSARAGSALANAAIARPNAMTRGGAERGSTDTEPRS